jgi:DNA-binding NarL/FixJ family response regulator
MLVRYGYTKIIEAKSGIQFLNLLKHYTPEIVFIEIHLTDINWILAIGRALTINPGLKIVAVTTIDDERFANTFKKIGGTAYVLKGVMYATLADTLLRIKNGDNFFSYGLKEKELNKAKTKLFVTG